MIKTQKDKYNQRFVEVEMTTKIQVYFIAPHNQDKEEVTKEEIKEALEECLDYYAGSNTGSEWLANLTNSRDTNFKLPNGEEL